MSTSSSTTATQLADALEHTAAERDTAHAALTSATNRLVGARTRRAIASEALEQLEQQVRAGDTTATAERHVAATTNAQFTQLQLEGTERAQAAAVAAHAEADAAAVAAEVAHDLTKLWPAERVTELRAAAVAALTELTTTARGRNAALREANERLEAAGHPPHRPIFSGRLEAKVGGKIHEGTESVDSLPDTIAAEVRDALRTY